MTDLKKVRIAGTGSYVPEKILDNKYFESIVETSDKWITERSGIKERRVLDDTEKATSFMAAEAARKALEASKTSPDEIDLVIVGTVTADMLFPSCACMVSGLLGMKHDPPAFDLSAGCSGFLYSMSIGRSFIANGTYKKVLVIGSELLSRITDFEDRNTCVLFGDAAGAVVLEESEDDSEILSTNMWAREETELLHLPAGGTLRPATHDTVEERLHYTRMNGREVFKFAVARFSEMAKTELEQNGWGAGEIDMFVPHQVNIRIIQAFCKRLDVPIEKVKINLDKYGNTSAASIPVALDEAVREGSVKRGDVIMMLAVGAGMAWSSATIRY